MAKKVPIPEGYVPPKQKPQREVERGYVPPKRPPVKPPKKKSE